MTGEPWTFVERIALVEERLSRIEAHLRQATRGHDPYDHLLAIERLARAARSELDPPPVGPTADA